MARIRPPVARYETLKKHYIQRSHDSMVKRQAGTEHTTRGIHEQAKRRVFFPRDIGQIVFTPEGIRSIKAASHQHRQETAEGEHEVSGKEIPRPPELFSNGEAGKCRQAKARQVNEREGMRASRISAARMLRRHRLFYLSRRFVIFHYSFATR